MWKTVILAVTLSLGLASAAWAAGGGGGDSGSTVSKPTPYDTAIEAVKRKDYDEALRILEGIVAGNPRNANAWNYIGYSHRKLGAFEPALAAYGKALAINPDHRGANEYLGELYLQTGELAKAKERLARLDDLCFFGCEEFDDLKEAIRDYEATHKGG